MKTGRSSSACLVVLALLLALVSPAGGAGPHEAAAPDPITAEGQGLHLAGLCFSPYLPGQGPGWTNPLPDGQVAARLGTVAPSTDWIRSFGTVDGLEAIGPAAHALGKKVAVGAYLSSDRDENERQIAELIRIGQAGEADVLVVGNEVLTLRDRYQLPEAELLGYIARVKEAVPALPVTTAEGYHVYLANESVMNAVDVAYINIYPYWQRVGIDDALAMTRDAYEQVRQKAGGKPVVISETGWPSAGPANGEAVPSLANGERYLAEFTSWAGSAGVPYFYFSAFDEAYKAAPYEGEGEVGAHWGLWDQYGVPKYGILGGSAPAPAQQVRITGIPPPGDGGTSVSGTATGAVPGQSYVALYIRVDGAWWGAKPSWEDALSPIAPDGTWTTVFATDGNDAAATEFAAYLLPGGVTPPEARGDPWLPAALDQYPHHIAGRTGPTYAQAREYYVAGTRAWGQAWGSSDVGAIRQYLGRARAECVDCRDAAAKVTDPASAANLALVRAISTAYIDLADAALAMYDGAETFGAGQAQMAAGNHGAAATSFDEADRAFGRSQALFSQATASLQSAQYAGTEYGDGVAYTAAIVPILDEKRAFMGEYAVYARGWRHTALAYGARSAGDQAAFQSEAREAMSLFDGLRASPSFGALASANYGILAGQVEKGTGGPTSETTSPTTPPETDGPSISFTTVPPGSSQETMVVGRAAGVVFDEYRVTLYILVRGRWWGPKPAWDAPLTPIAADGTWRTRFATDGVDGEASRFAAFLVPAPYDPPDLAGTASLPEELSRFPGATAAR